MKLIHLVALTFLFIASIFEVKGQDLGDKGQEISIVVDKKDATSENSSDGYIYLKIEGGSSPYKIHCFSPYNKPTQSIGNELKLKNIKSGDYLFVIQDATGKTVTKEIQIINHR